MTDFIICVALIVFVCLTLRIWRRYSNNCKNCPHSAECRKYKEDSSCKNKH